MPVPAASSTRAALENLLLDEIARLTHYPRSQIRSDWDLDRDLRLDWVFKGRLLEALLRDAPAAIASKTLPPFHFDELHTAADVVDLVTGSPKSRISNRLQSDPEEAEAFPLPIVPMSGTPYEMGLAHAMSQGLAILRVMRKIAEVIGPRLDDLPELEDVLAKRDRYFSPSELEELEGAAEGMGLPVRHMIALNVGLYPEYIPGCMQFAVTARRNPDAGLVHAVNEDSPVALMLREELTRMVHVRRPATGIACLTFSIVGQIGGLNGINAAGIAVSSTILLDCPLRQETRYGCVHPILVARILENADSLEAAVEIVKNSERAGAWSLCISHAETDRLCYLEYDGARLAVRMDVEHLATSNHCLLLKPVKAAPAHSRHRLGRLTELLGWDQGRPLSISHARKVLRDRFDPSRGRETRFPTMSTLRRVDNQGSIVMRPCRGELWMTPGPMADDAADRYHRINVQKLLEMPEPEELPQPACS